MLIEQPMKYSCPPRIHTNIKSKSNQLLSLCYPILYSQQATCSSSDVRGVTYKIQNTRFQRVQMEKKNLTNF